MSDFCYMVDGVVQVRIPVGDATVFLVKDPVSMIALLPAESEEVCSVCEAIFPLAHFSKVDAIIIKGKAGTTLFGDTKCSRPRV